VRVLQDKKILFVSDLSTLADNSDARRIPDNGIGEVDEIACDEV